VRKTVFKHPVLQQITQEEEWQSHIWRPKRVKSFRDNPIPSLKTIFWIKLFDGEAILKWVSQSRLILSEPSCNPQNAYEKNALTYRVHYSAAGHVGSETVGNGANQGAGTAHCCHLLFTSVNHCATYNYHFGTSPE
jgi:hypothetical protein